jgi:NADPH:quinone reductase-like Zn-dependent oxidoreductase
MSSITANIAAWIPAEKARAMEIASGPTPNPAEDEVVIEVAYAAVNPTDWKVISTVDPYYDWDSS